jgi:glycogen debranching enzyme
MTAERPRFEIIAEDGGADERTLVLARGDSFALFDRHGDFTPSSSGRHGLFFDGTRFLSALMLRLARRRPLLLSSSVRTANQGLAIHLANPDLINSDEPRVPRETLYLYRSIELEDGGCRFGIALRSFDERSLDLELELAFAADFADVFEVRGAHRPRRGQVAGPELRRQGVTLAYIGLDRRERRTELAFSRAPETLGPDFARFRLEVGPGRPSALELAVRCELGGKRGARAPRFSLPGAPRRSAPAALLPSSSNPAFDQWARRSAHDLAMLTVETAQGPFPFAGVPWFATPFGRDSLITAYSVLWLDPGLARGVLRFLASHQAHAASRAEDAEPGKIVHEMRSGEMAALGEIPFGRYYGSVDVTPWFVLLASAYHERTADDALARELWPNLLQALAWMDGPGDPDQDGFVEYRQRSLDGLSNHGWKDSSDSIMHADGSLAAGPIALCEVQAYVYAAKAGLARVAQRLGELALSERLEHEARALRERFERAFWCEELGTFALALDADKRPCRVPSSNAGHALFAGIASPEHAARVAHSLLAPDSFSGWGVRTLAASAARFNPMSYHNGSVWPHDNALVALGLARYGATAGAERIFGALFDASLSMEEARLPELLCGFDRVDGEQPTLYPVACSPQAWSAASVFLLLQSVLRLSIDASRRQVRVSRPTLPAFLDWVALREIGVDGATVDLLWERSGDETHVRILRQTGHVELVVSAT